MIDNTRNRLIDRLQQGGDCKYSALEYLEELYTDVLNRLLATNDFSLKQKHSGDLLRIADLKDIFSKAR